MLYATVSQGQPGQKQVTPIFASSDPEIVDRVVRAIADVLVQAAHHGIDESRESTETNR